LTQAVLKKLGLKDYRARLGTKDPNSNKYVGHDDNWKLATDAIEKACKRMGMAYEVSVGDAAFYGPKLDIIIKDALGRDWQMGTVQVDYNLPERFELEYIAEDSKPHRPVMIHRAPFGSLERMIGLMTEQYAGAFPLWLSPVQIAILPIADRHVEAAEALSLRLRDVLFDGRPMRVSVDDRRETLGKKIREAQMQKSPYMLIMGDRDIEDGTVGVRSREEGDLGPMTVEAFLERLRTDA
jgi:threonyl-tRNA synthetase